MKDKGRCSLGSGAVLIVLILLVNFESSVSGPDKKWVTGEGTQLVTGVSPEAARQMALDKARANAIESVVREVAGVEVLSRSDNGGSAGNYFSQRLSSRIFSRILEEEIVLDTARLITRLDGKPVSEQLIRIKVLVLTEEPTARSPYDIRLELNREYFQEGDSLFLKVYVSKTCYLHIFNITSDRRVLIMHPADAQAARPVPGGSVFVFPDRGRAVQVYPISGHDLDAEEIRVVATREPLIFSPADLDTVAAEAGYVDLASTSLNTLEMAIVQIPFVERAEATISYTVYAK